jgi:Mrp family chromosome partitioning ATPase
LLDLEKEDLAANMQRIKHKILVLSGKGGVGKSTVSSQLAFTLAKAGFKVGILDIDLCGPSIPKILGVDNLSVHSSTTGRWIPVYADREQRLSVMSIAFLLDDKNTAVVWRGPKKNAIIKQFLEDVQWGELDFLVVDTPPGTSDEHISICELLNQYNPDGAVIVTTPQGVSISDVRKEITFCRKIGLPILGLVENMSGFVCPHCAECTNVFSTGGGEGLAKELDIDFIGRIPLDPQIMSACEQGKSFTEVHSESTALKALEEFVEKFKSKTS